MVTPSPCLPSPRLVRWSRKTQTLRFDRHSSDLRDIEREREGERERERERGRERHQEREAERAGRKRGMDVRQPRLRRPTLIPPAPHPPQPPLPSSSSSFFFSSSHGQLTRSGPEKGASDWGERKSTLCASTLRILSDCLILCPPLPLLGSLPPALTPQLFSVFEAGDLYGRLDPKKR